MHPEKAQISMSVTEFGMSISNNFLQSSNACFPMYVTEFGMLMFVRFPQPQNKELLIAESELPMNTFDKLIQLLYL